MNRYNTGIYQIVNQTNGKRYVGSTANIKSRKYNHFKNLRENKHYNQHLQRSYNKYGKENIKFEILLYCDKENLLFYEQRAIDSYDFKKELYNISPTAGNCLGVKHTEESKKKKSEALKGEKCYLYGKKGSNHPCFNQKISKEHKEAVSKAQKGKILSKETKEKLRKINLGKKLSDETKQKISIKSSKPRPSMRGENNPLYGKPRSDEIKKKIGDAHRGEKHHNYGKKLPDEYRKKISESNKGKHNFSDEMKKNCSERQKGEKGYWFNKKGKENPNSRPIYQINKDTNEIIKKWDSITEAAKELNLHISLISKVCLKERKHTGGFKWKFVK